MQTSATTLPAKAGSSLTLPLFTIAIFLSAFLIFVVQPMFSKMVLPLLGGSPAVWNTAMVFFQACLLGGYLYAHLLVRFVPFRLQIATHMGVMLVGLLFIPFAINTAYLPSPDGFIPFSVILLFAVSIGYPFFALSANAPLLQSWFSRSGHKDAHDPYFLYGASNIGSALALLSYPVLIEPLLSVQGQTGSWSWGYVLLAAFILAASLSVRPAQGTPAATASPQGAEARPDISLKLCLRWVLAAAIPSSLMLGATNHITTNVAATPFLWVMPLALYLFTFVLVFDRKGGLPLKWIVWIHAILLLAALVFGDLLDRQILIGIGLHLALFFFSALLCHGDLARNRPAAKHLTTFYLLMSVGGVLGGAVTALLAPIVFSSVLEYPLMIAATCLFLPAASSYWKAGIVRTISKDMLVVAGVLVSCAALTFGAVELKAAYGADLSTEVTTLGALVLLLPVIFYVLAIGKPVRATLLAFAIIAITATAMPRLFFDKDASLVSIERSFFGVSKVASYVRADGIEVHQFNHGKTVHNVQLRGETHERIPLAYYHTEGPFADAIAMARRLSPTPSIASIGLGAGALACYVQPGENWRFYEIDNAVIDMARNPELFSYVELCAPDAPIILGDARLKVAEEPDASFDLVIVDAFTSNAIPAHLLTREAIDMYLAKLKPGGILFFHVSNRFADVGSVVISSARERGLESRYIVSKPSADSPFHDLRHTVAAVVMADAGTISRTFDDLGTWKDYDPNPAVGEWTDDWSNVFGSLLAKYRGGPIQP